LFTGTENSEIYISDSQLSNSRLFRCGHKSEVVDLDGIDSIFVSIDKIGIVKLWNECKLVKEIPPKGLSAVLEGRTVCLSLDTKEILAGYSNGNINCFDFNGAEKWEILDSHKGGISTLFMVEILLTILNH
jgi:WD40 repeat protein